LLVITVISPLLAWQSRRGPLWRIVVAFVVRIAVESIISSESRLVYLVPIAVAMAVGLLAQSPQRLPRQLSKGTQTLALAGLGVLAALGLTAFPSQVSYYGSFVPQGTVSALDWIQSHTARNALMLVAPIDGVPFGWWVEGYARRPSLVAAADAWLYVPRERTRSGEAVRLLTAPDVLAQGNLNRDRRAGVDWIVLPWSWGGITMAQLQGFRAEHPRAIVYSNNALAVIELPR